MGAFIAQTYAIISYSWYFHHQYRLPGENIIIFELQGPIKVRQQWH